MKKKGGSAGLAKMLRSTSPLPQSSASRDAGDTSPVPSPVASLSPRSISPKRSGFDLGALAAPKCAACEKTVYKMEEILAVGKTWHKTCFTCSGTKKDGCNKVLARDGYLDNNQTPYCNACYSKLFRPKGVGYSATLSTDYGPGTAGSPAARSISPNSSIPAARSTSPNLTRATASGLSPQPGTLPPAPPAGPPPPPPPSTSAPSLAPAPSIAKINAAEETADIQKHRSTSPNRSLAFITSQAPKVATDVTAQQQQQQQQGGGAISPKKTLSFLSNAASAAPKCTSCAKTVYKMEETVAVGRTWHSACFTCGGTNKEGLGCKRVLKRDGYVDHENQPFCNSCYSKLFRPKGFGYGNTLNTDYGETSPTAVSPKSPPASTAAASTADNAMAEVTTGVSSLAAAYNNPGTSSVPSPTKPTPRSRPAPPAQAPAPASAAAAGVAAGPGKVKIAYESSYVGDDDEVDESEW